jgi:hypothetical protein
LGSGKIKALLTHIPNTGKAGIQQDSRMIGTAKQQITKCRIVPKVSGILSSIQMDMAIHKSREDGSRGIYRDAFRNLKPIRWAHIRQFLTLDSHQAVRQRLIGYAINDRAFQNIIIHTQKISFMDLPDR